ncbi:hypothetical protein [Heyndrickxia coagulans]|nr:hypothetical protein [Heyndrickxia coagulans]UZH07651.1 hypothetical protein ONG97_07030 [Heyndrickxia coagulans]
MPDKREVTHRDNEAETVVNDAHGSNQVGLFSEHNISLINRLL